MLVFILMNHYVCTGDCEAEESKAGVCMAAGCTKEGEPLVACTCEDGLHEKVLGDNALEENDE
ncbi:MAG: hypothetical protein A3D56_02035 [Candidatus Taylorbacteria bacterium RIFCSPHIGHO2_02_FULL_45_35]|uniref:Uncharacterized protein n=1 Tax=Candidatus Taylorbacteria bacterium RIFCSPHIGHO2_02_FULL_45_35 TaxID=1802311 RepID=A0A1G2MTM2_9BACT|nr:MAG: hypothetical protein A3D56_02035 [Candidatus Taylorbacteria bacterium RIFCSPHIGHO2_02_FULL_45_35]